tara:strand:+ start:321 stop:629 length:309 start_codon:yes stop_codon:yes gene_type:complete
MKKTTKTNGTCLQGRIESSYGNLVHHLGNPHITAEDNKTDVEWGFKFSDGTIATIYNYKDGKAYLGEKGKSLQDITYWHIGGFSKKAYLKIQNIIESKRIDL